ncbi:T9SS C-terminal target domain-containing protein [Pontibacter actiniarum]|nr:T9SS C-terminal target domain-containing protein [Pontibacter actiniarum]
MKTTSTFIHLTLTLCSMLLMAGAAEAQVSMEPRQNLYSQNFEALPAAGTSFWKSGSYYLPGWAVFRTKADSTFTANTGQANTGGLYSYGATNSPDRALGSIASSPAGQFTYNLLLQNNTGSTIKSVEVGYTGEQWRISNITAGQHVLSFWYAVSSDVSGFNTSPSSDKGWTEVPELKFYGPKYQLSGGPINGNAAENRRMLEAFLQVEVPAGHFLMLRWKDADEVEADHGLAVDDVTVLWHEESVESPVPLPVELASFKARAKGNQVELQWLTASEDRNSHFIVERSPDGKSFEGVGQLTGQGTTMQVTSYTFLDEVPLPGTSYYRLKQVDEDESYTYSAVVSVLRAVAQGLKVFPTITAGDLVVSADARLRQALVIDVMGKQLYAQQLQSNLPQHSLNVSSLSSGTYVLVLLDEQGKRYTSRFRKR